MRLFNYAALILLAACACGYAQDRSICKEAGYGIQFPDGWNVRKRGMEFIASSAGNDAYSSIEFQRLPVGVTVAKIIELNMGSFKKTLTDFKQLDGGAINVPAINSQARWVTVSYTGDNGPVTTTYYFVFSMKDRKMFTVACGAPAASFDKRRAEFDGIARSLVQD
jgi:hypothetical protein